ncbi:unnamed protein product [Phytomonas sp. Hart1]|nr:unnamed protein product [Phytomonas sp. Hart1]|eukprot:CCW69509.1 unnamed protein product [Phytomonas sp. isolate Hart1]
MDFDDLDEHISFEEEVSRIRSRILLSSTRTASYDELINKYSAFNDVLREAKKRGRLISSVLVAAEGILQFALSSTEITTSRDSPRLNLCSKEEAKLLQQLLRMYMHLYSNYPVPTRQQWKEAVVLMISNEVDITSIQKDFNFNTVSHSSYITALLQVLQMSMETTTLCEIESDDGSFVDAQFIYLLKRLLILGRKSVPRSSVVNTQNATKTINEMLQAVRQFVNSNTIDW